MKYYELIGVKEGYNDVFDLVDEQKGYWKRFVTNKQFEDNLLRIMRVFQSPVGNDHKSIWVEGTYGTGKSHSTSVIKHLLSDPIEEIDDVIKNLMSNQLRNEIYAYRRTKRIFPVVIKGNHNITEANDMNSVIQREVKGAFKKAGISLNVSSDFDTVLNLLKDPNFASICDELVNNDLSDYLSSKEELFQKLEEEDPGILKIIHKKLKKYNLFAATNNITVWLKEVKKFIRENNIANDLVIFWDEFTSLLSISERRAIYSIVQDIAELSKGDGENGGIYIFLITHVTFETTDIVKDMGSDERQHIRDRFVFLSYQIQYDTTYTILFSALDRLKPDVLDKLVDDRVKRNMEVVECLDAVVKDSSDPDESKHKIFGLYPFHPYTAYISTFLARIIGSSERSIFNFINDKDNGFLSFIENDVDERKFLNIDSLWDFFLEKFKENPKYFEILDVFKKNMDSVKSKGREYFEIFKAILLLNIMQSAVGTDEDSDERSLTSPSITNIERAFSGTYSKSEIEKCLDELDSDGIIQKTPDNRYEFAVSSTPREKINTKLIPLREKYSSVSDILSTFPASSDTIKKVILESNNLKRPSVVEFFGANYKETSLTNTLDLVVKDNPGHVVVALFMHLGFSISETSSEFTQDELRAKLIDISNREKYRNVVFLQLNNVVFEKRRYNGFLEQMARMEIANESGSTADGTTCRQNASRWVAQFVNEVRNAGNVHLIFSGTSISCSYADVPSKITAKILPAIYKYGLDGLKRIKNTVWKIKKAPQPKTIGKMLSATKQEILSDSKLCDLLLNESGQCVFNDNLEFDSSFDETPVSRLCSEVKKIMVEHQNDTNMDVTNHFEWIFKPPYGYIMTESSMAAIGLAFRPFINKMFVTSTSSIIDSLKMVTFINDLMDYYLRTEKDSPILHVRFSSQEERDLMDVLINTFGLDRNENDGLLNIKWNLRDKFKKDNKAPLWVLKYVPKENTRLASLFDDLFEFTQKQNDEIDSKIVTSLLKEIKDKRLDIINAINDVKKEDCLTLFVEYQLKKEGHPELDIEECIKRLQSDLSGEVIFWSERDVADSFRRFVDDKINPKIVLDPDDHDGEHIPPTPYTLGSKEKLINKLNNSNISKEQLIKLLTNFANKRPAYAKELLDLLEEEE